MKTVRYPEGCAMTLYLPLVVLTNTDRVAADPTKFTDLSASISRCGVVTQLSPVITDSYLTMPLAATLAAGSYKIMYSFKYDGVANAGSIDGKLEIVKDNAQSNWGTLISDGIAHLEDQVFIAGSQMTDAEFEALKAEYRLKIAAAEAATTAANTAKAAADAVAYNAVNNLTPETIKSVVSLLVFPDQQKNMMRCGDGHTYIYIGYDGDYCKWLSSDGENKVVYTAKNAALNTVVYSDKGTTQVGTIGGIWKQSIAEVCSELYYQTSKIETIYSKSYSVDSKLGTFTSGQSVASMLAAIQSTLTINAGEVTAELNSLTTNEEG